MCTPAPIFTLLMAAHTMHPPARARALPFPLTTMPAPQQRFSSPASSAQTSSRFPKTIHRRRAPRPCDCLCLHARLVSSRSRRPLLCTPRWPWKAACWVLDPVHSDPLYVYTYMFTYTMLVENTPCLPWFLPFQRLCTPLPNLHRLRIAILPLPLSRRRSTDAHAPAVVDDPERFLSD